MDLVIPIARFDLLMIFLGSTGKDHLLGMYL